MVFYITTFALVVALMKNTIYDRVAASEMHNFIEDSEVTYESLRDKSEWKTEAALSVPTALDDGNAKHPMPM